MRLGITYLYSLITLGGATLLQMVFVLILARELGASEFGRFSIYASALAIAIEVCGLGGGDFFIREGGRGARKIPELAGYCLTYGATSTLFLAPALFLFVGLFQVVDLSMAIFFSIALDLLFSRYGIFVEYFYMGLGRATTANTIRLAINFLKVSAAAFYFYYPGHHGLLEEWLLLQGCMSALTGVLALVIFKRQYGITFPYLRGSMVIEAFPFGITQLLRVFQANFDRLLLGWILPMEAVGAYSAVSRFTSASLTPVLALLRGSVSGFYDAAATGHEALKHHARAVAAKAFWLTVATTLGLLVGLVGLEKVIGEDYTGVIEIGMALVPSLFLMVSLYVVGDYANALGLAMTRMYITIFGLLLYVALALGLGLLFGLWGVLVAISLSSLCSLLMYLTVLVGFWRRRL